MQNFRENKAYRLSLYSLLLAPIVAGGALILNSINPNLFSIIILLFSPLLFLASILLRFLSLDPLKRWMDFIFLLLAGLLQLLVTVLSSHTCYPLSGNEVTPQWTPASMFEICSPYDILGETQTTATVFVVISLALAMWFLISDIRRKRATITTI